MLGRTIPQEKVIHIHFHCISNHNRCLTYVKRILLVWSLGMGSRL